MSSHPPENRPLAVIFGPTGSGKSDLALRVAQSLDGEIVNCDSIQIYRHFNLGAAKLPESERQGIPHHLIDILEPNEEFTAGDYARRAREALAEISGRGRLPVVAGGTGFYLRALLDGLVQVPGRDVRLRERLERRAKAKPDSLHRILRRIDPVSADRIHPRDLQKLIRAIEVCLIERRRLSEIYTERRDALEGFRVIKIGLDPDRKQLYAVLDARVERMFASGLVQEVRNILALGCSGAEKPFESLGYKEALAVVRGSMSEAEAIDATKLQTRRYAKRQWTWFRRESGHRLSGFGHQPETVRQALELLRALP